MMSLTVVTRFAPSPTGELHLGSAYSALDRLASGARGRRHVSWCASRTSTSAAAGANSRRRSSPTSKWLGFDWDGEVRRQSEHFADYGKALDQLDAARPDLSLLLQPRRHRARARGLGQRAARPPGPTDRSIPGTCRHLSVRGAARRSIAAGHEHCLRLDSARAAAEAGPYHFVDEALRPHRGRAAADGRLRDRAQGHADQLSPRGHGRRPPAGRDPGDARR